MRQQVFDFVVESWATRGIPLDPAIVEDVVELMAAAIVAFYERGIEESNDEPSRTRQDHD